MALARAGKVAEYPVAQEAGGLSGPPLFEMSTAVLSDLYRLTGGRLALVGCGGISSGEDAYRKIRAGERTDRTLGAGGPTDPPTHRPTDPRLPVSILGPQPAFQAQQRNGALQLTRLFELAVGLPTCCTSLRCCDV